MIHGIVIPCYNESTRLKLEEFQRFIDLTDEYTLCFVNDGSSDNTYEMLRSFRRGQPDRVKIVDLKKNVGKAEAVKRGIQYMLDNSKVEDIGFIDADLSTDFRDYQLLVIKRMKHNLDMAFGSRKMSKSGIERSWVRSLTSTIVGALIQSVVRLPIHDTQCGAKVFKRSAAELAFRQSFTTRWLFDVELFIRFKKIFGKKWVMDRLLEVPLMRWQEVEGSKLTLKDSLKIPAQLLQIIKVYSVMPYLRTLEQSLMMFLGYRLSRGQ